MVNAFGVEHTPISKAKMTPEEREAKRLENIRQMEARGITPKGERPASSAAPEAPKPRRQAPPAGAAERVQAKADVPRYTGHGTAAAREWTGRHPARGVKRLTWEITGSQAKNWAIGAGVAAGAAYGAKKIADRNRTVSKSKKDKAKDAAATGLGAGSGLVAAKTGRNVAGWVGREMIKDQRYKHLDNTSSSPHRKAMTEHNKKYEAVTSNPDVDFAGNKKARTAYFRNYPKDVPGGRLQRALAYDGHPAAKGTVLTAGAVAGGLAAHHYYQKQKKVTVAKKKDERPSQSKKVPDYLSPVLPASTVRAYDNSHGHKLEAGVKNFTAKTGGAAIGGGLGLGATMLATRKIPALRDGLKFGSKKAVSSGTLRGWTQSTGAGAGGALGGAVGGSYSLKRIQENPRHRYQEN